MNCLVSAFCCNADLDGLKTARSDCRRLAEETTGICMQARDRAQAVLDYSTDVKDKLKSLGRHIGPSTFLTIKDLVENNKVKEAKKVALEMDDFAQGCIDKSIGMADALQKGVDSLPDPVKDELKDENTDDDDEEETKELLTIDQDIEDIENCTRNLKKMNLLSAARSGVDAFQGLSDKEVVCRSMFQKVKDICGSIVRLSEAMAENCCVQVQSIAAEAPNLFKGLRSSHLITKVAKALQKLIQAMIRLMDAAWDKIKGFMEEFQAAKKIKNFVLKPLGSGSFRRQKVKEGMGVVGNFLPGSLNCTSIVAGCAS